MGVFQYDLFRLWVLDWFLLILLKSALKLIKNLVNTEASVEQKHR